jgi:glycerol uptake facilitator-like aquaporin
LAGVAIGLTVTLLVLALAPLSGGAFNPVRWAGPALLLGDLDGALVYLLGPLLGGFWPWPPRGPWPGERPGSGPNPFLISVG